MVKSNQHWRRNPRILKRMRDVERLRFEGLNIPEISERTGIPTTTVENDLIRLAQLWQDHLNKSQEEHRAQLLAELDDVRARTLQTARYSRSPATHHNVARQSTMDKAKLLNLLIERQEVSGPNGQPLFPLEQLREAFIQSERRDDASIG
jgi:hypothetical protein